MIQSSQLQSGNTMPTAAAQELSNRCHIYLICQHPAVSFSKENFRYVDGHIEGSIAFKVNGVEDRFDYRIEFPLLDNAVAVTISPYPHREILTLDANGKTVRRLPASAICFGSAGPIDHSNLRQFKVLYIGQAFAKGNRSAFQRLQSHSTLQKILAEMSYNDPDSEVFLMMFDYLPYRTIIHMDPRSKDAIDDESDSARFYSIEENPLTKRQQICLVEAALIRYFSPLYNEIFKESFPSSNQKLLQQCYKLDFAGLIVEINTDELLFKLYSDSVEPSMHHIAYIDLLGHLDRLGFFHFQVGKGKVLTIPGVIRQENKKSE